MSTDEQRDLWKDGFMGDSPADAVWDEETGETLAEARVRFATFGDLLDVDEALAAMVGGEVDEVWSFGYGDDPELFTTVSAEELSQARAEDGYGPVMRDWGPFIVLTKEA